MQEGVADLGQIVRRDAGRHADGDALRAVGEQIGEAAGQHDRLRPLAVVGRAEIDRVLVDAGEQRLGDAGEARLGVAHGRGVVAVDVAEIALAVDQRVAHGEVLGQAHHGVVDRGVAMGMELAHDVADDARRLLVARAGVEVELAHGVEQAAMDGLEAVAHVGQRPRHDRGEGIGQVALAERLGELDRAEFLVRAGRALGHRQFIGRGRRRRPSWALGV